MKFFSTFLTAVFIALLGVVGTMAQTSDQVISAIQSFITASRSLDTQVSGLNAINFPTQGFVRLPRIVLLVCFSDLKLHHRSSLTGSTTSHQR